MKINAVDSIRSYSSRISARAREYFENSSFADLKGKVDKDTLIGLGVMTGILILAIKSINSIKNELEKINRK